jgi:molybdopterin-binding protein
VPAANHAPQPNPNANANLSSQGSGTVQQGTLTAVNGTTVTLRLSNGKTQTYAVSAQTAEELRASIGKPLAFRVQNGVLVVAGHEGNPPVHGTLTMLNGTNARVRLANGTVQTFTVTAQQAAQLKARVGKSIVFWTAANGTLRLDRRTRTSRQGEKSH